MIKKNKNSKEFDKSISMYFKDISKYKPLSRTEEFKLWKKYKYENDIDARNKIVSSNLKFVANVAKGFQGLGLSYSDLIAEGNIGLIKAIDKFDAYKGFKTISYSVWWIRQTIIEAINKRNSIEADDLPTETNTPELNIESEEYINNIEETLNNIFINNEFDEQDKERTEKLAISRLTESLSEKEKTILTKYYGLNGEKQLTLEEIGNELGITKERVRQINEKTLKKLRSSALIFGIDETIYNNN